MESEILNKTEEDSEKQITIIYCQICSLNQFKYKCPRCQMKTCSLLCVKQHKKKFSCNGIKDKFSSSLKCEKDLIKDIKFLNETLRNTNNSSKKMFLLNDNDERKDREKKNKYNKKCAKKFRNVNLICSPSIMKKFSENKSYVDFKNKKFYWTIKFIFISNINSNIEHLFKEPFDDTQTTLNSIIKQFLENKHEMDFELLRFFNTLPENTIEMSNIIYRINIKENKVNGKIIKLNKMIYEECDRNLSLKDLLDGKDVLEYPEFLVILHK